MKFPLIMEISVLTYYVIVSLHILASNGVYASRTNLQKPVTILEENLNLRNLRETKLNKYESNRGNATSLTKNQKKKLKKERRKERRRFKQRMKEMNFPQVPKDEIPRNFKAESNNKMYEASQIQENSHHQIFPVPPRANQNYFPDMKWLANNLTSIWQLLQQMQKDIKQIRRTNRSQQQTLLRKEEPSERKIPTKDEALRSEITTEKCNPEWAIDPLSCQQEPTAAECGGKGKCLCGQCQCEAPFYGRHCQCNDHLCDSFGGIMCGGAGRGQCRCGRCVCRPGFMGGACECSTSTESCKSNYSGVICAGHGECICDRCHCTEGYAGKWCQDSIYSASVCEQLKPCVLCLAFGRKYPQCEECQIEIQYVDKLELSQNTCLMINLGCILNYAYDKNVHPNDIKTVFVPKGMSCPPS